LIAIGRARFGGPTQIILVISMQSAFTLRACAREVKRVCRNAPALDEQRG